VAKRRERRVARCGWLREERWEARGGVDKSREVGG
jgi:hypothetical protein